MIWPVICMTHFLGKCRVNSGEGGRRGNLVAALLCQYDVFHYRVDCVNKTRQSQGRWVCPGHMTVWSRALGWCNECDECLYWLSEDQTGLREGLGQGSRVCPDMRISHQESYTITITITNQSCHLSDWILPYKGWRTLRPDAWGKLQKIPLIKPG